MSATNPNGDEKYWINGQPTSGLQNPVAKDTGTILYWLNGQPSDILIPTGNTTKFLLIF